MFQRTLFLLLLSPISIFSHAQAKLSGFPPSEASKHIGESGYIRGKIQSRTILNEKDSITIINQNGANTDRLEVIVPIAFAKSINEIPEDSLADVILTVLGVVTLANQAPQLHIVNQADIRVTSLKKLIAEEYSYVFTKVEHPPTYPGGKDAWIKYLSASNMSEATTHDRTPAGSYPVKIQYQIDTAGIGSSFQILTIPNGCPSCGTAALKILKGVKAWIPAVQNGRKVKFRTVETIVFEVPGK